MNLLFYGKTKVEGQKLFIFLFFFSFLVFKQFSLVWNGPYGMQTRTTPRRRAREGAGKREEEGGGGDSRTDTALMTAEKSWQIV